MPFSSHPHNVMTMHIFSIPLVIGTSLSAYKLLVKKVNGQSVAEPPCFPISPLESFAPLEALSRSGQSKS